MVNYFKPKQIENSNFTELNELAYGVGTAAQTWPNVISRYWNRDESYKQIRNYCLPKESEKGREAAARYSLKDEILTIFQTTLVLLLLC